VVEDEGIGMNEEQLSRVFEPFEQADNSTRRQFGGTGLGLSITRKMCDLLGGELQVESTLGKGSRFTARLPLVRGERRRSGPVEKNFRPGLSAIVVDDNSINLSLMKSVMKNLKITCQTCSSGKDFLERVGEAHPDFVLLDLHMPDMDGMEVLEAMPKELLPITFMLSADVFQDSRDACHAKGVNTFLAKPLDIDEFVGVLSKAFPGEEGAKGEGGAAGAMPTDLVAFAENLEKLKSTSYMDKEVIGDLLEAMKGLVPASSSWLDDLDELESMSLTHDQNNFLACLEKLKAKLA